MKLSPFTLIYQPEGEVEERATRRTANTTPDASEVRDPRQRIKAIRKRAPKLAKSLQTLNPNLSRTLVASTYAHQTAEPEVTAEDKLQPVIEELQREKSVVTVALWDLDAKIGALPQVVKALNHAQPLFTFFELQAPVPAGLVIKSNYFSQWARHRLNKPVSKGDASDFDNNLMFNDFYKHARLVHESTGVDYLICITKNKVAFEERGRIYWNYFSTSIKKTILVSAYELRRYAREAGRPFEVAVTGVALAQLLKTLNKKLKYHEENRGCLFDFNDDRESIIRSIREARIEPQCLVLIDLKYRAAAEAMVDALRNYAPQAEELSPKTKGKRGGAAGSGKAEQDDEYWLAKLEKLSEKAAKGSSR